MALPVARVQVVAVGAGIAAVTVVKALAAVVGHAVPGQVRGGICHALAEIWTRNYAHVARYTVSGCATIAVELTDQPGIAPR